MKPRNEALADITDPRERLIKRLEWERLTALGAANHYDAEVVRLEAMGGTTHYDKVIARRFERDIARQAALAAQAHRDADLLAEELAVVSIVHSSPSVLAQLDAEEGPFTAVGLVYVGVDDDGHDYYRDEDADRGDR
jgi:hypothetical protein